MIQRTIFPLVQSRLGKGKTLLIYGARQVGKTTLVKQILEWYGSSGVYIDCEIVYNRDQFSKPDDVVLKSLLHNKKLLVIDEAQKIPHIWSVLKVLHDHLPEIQVIATWSSSFELAQRSHEHLTGRSIEFVLHPLSVEEIGSTYTLLQLPSKLPQLLQFGSYPGVFDHPIEESRETLLSIANNYLYKDILEFSGIRKSDLLIHLLQLLALQVWQEVSYSELAQKLGISTLTVQQYIDLLIKSFVLFRLTWLSRNLRNEITKSVKLYFWDIGILNSLINNFNPPDLRSDRWGLRENFCIAEKMKQHANHRVSVQTYFWRTYTQQEIDYIEEKDGKFFAFECKYNPKATVKAPKLFREAYPSSTFTVLHPGNIFHQLIT